MLRSYKSLQNLTLAARDGEIGATHDLLFDDQAWIVRYLVADTSRWLPGRKVLLAPQVITSAGATSQTVSVDLTRTQIKSSPPIDTDQPVSRQQEVKLHQHYQWTSYWANPGLGVSPMPAPGTVAMPAPSVPTLAGNSGDPHLRSAREVIGYRVEARDGRLGPVVGLIIDDESWIVRYLLIDTRAWLPGKKVLVAPEWKVGRFHWGNQTVTVGLTCDKVRSCPEYDPDTLITRDYESRLYDHYGEPGYWLEQDPVVKRS